MPRHQVDGVEVWFGTSDAPAPSGSGINVAPEISVGIAPGSQDAKISIRYRRLGGPWHRFLLQPRTTTSTASYFGGRFPTLPVGAKIEYAVYYRCGGARPRPECQVGEVIGFEVNRTQDRVTGSPRVLTAGSLPFTEPGGGAGAGTAPSGSVDKGNRIRDPGPVGLPADARRVTSVVPVVPERVSLPYEAVDPRVNVLPSIPAPFATATTGALDSQVIGGEALATLNPRLPSLPGLEETPTAVAAMYRPTFSGLGFTPSSNDAGGPHMTWTVKGRLASHETVEPGLLARCRVEVFFEHWAPVDSLDFPATEPKSGMFPGVLELGIELPSKPNKTIASPDGVTVNARVSAHSDETGKFEVTLPDKAELASRKLRFMVSAPSGETLADRYFDVEAVEDLVLIQVPRLVSIPQPTDVPQPVTRRIKGRVIERNCKPLPSCMQILLFARKSGGENTETDGGHTPVFVASADSSGYFFGEAANEKYESATASIAGVAEEINVALEEGALPARVLLVVDLPEGGKAQAAKDNCNCEGGMTPRAPSHADIEEAPDTYSTDLGTGGCVKFNTPNRAIEEYDFYSVVRTTEPEIRALGEGAARVSVRVEHADSDVIVVDTGSEVATAAVLRAVEAEAKAAVLEAEATAAAAAAEVEAAENRATTREAEAKAATKEALEAATLPIGGPSEQEAKELQAAAARAEAVAVAARVAADAAAVKAAATTKEVEAKKAESAAEIASATRAVAEAKAAAAEARASAKAMAEARARAEAMAEARARARSGANKAPGRAELNAANSIDWDSTPTFYEATTIALGHLLHFKQVWYADGYSLGDLLYSLPLAPGQKKLMSVLDWERRETTQRTEGTFGSEALDAALSHDRDLGEVVTGALTEMARGGSKNTTFGVGAGHGGAMNGSYYGMNFGGLHGVSGGYGESNSSAWQDSARNLSANSLQTLRDRTLQSASAIRSLRSSVVHTVTQGESVRATTEVVANHNHCHALTIQYFEVLRHLKVTHELTDVQECLFVPLPLQEFSRAKALRWRQTLQVYLQRRELSGGFDAARRVETAWTEVNYPTARYADESITSISGELQLTLLIPLPPFPERPKPRPEDTLADTVAAIEKATNPTVGWMGAVLAIATGGASLIGYATTATIANGITAGARAASEDLYAQPTAKERYDKFHTDIMPGIAEGFVDQLELHALVNGAMIPINEADFTLVSEYRPGAPLLVSVRSTVKNIKRGDVSQLIIKSANGLPTGCRAIVNSTTIRYRTAKFEHAFVDDRRVNDDIDLPKIGVTFSDLLEINVQRLTEGKGAALYTPIDEWEQRDPKIEDARLAAELIEHLNDNLEFYHHAIWWTMDPNRRYMLLDGYDAPGANGRSVASVVENRLIGIVGNSLVMPVARGNHLDPRFPKGTNADLLDFYTLDSPVPASRVSLPTRGVFAEAVMGSCNACEQIDDSRFWRWEESPIDEPPSIEPLSTATRRSEPASIQPTPFPTPIVSIQNAPNAPDPTGVRAVLDALGRQSFSDITGLAGTQANAAAAYSKAVDTALQYGKEASTLTQQAAMLGAKDRALNAIDKAEADGQISAEDAKQLRVSALKKMVGEAPTDEKASSVADRLKVIDDQDVKGSITKENSAALREQVLRGLEAEVAPRIDQQKATNEAIRKIPAGSVESVETRDSSGAMTSIKAAGPEIQPAVFGKDDVDEARHYAPLWADLLRFEAPSDVVAALQARGMTVQRLVDAIGDLNLDLYPVKVSTLPTINGKQVDAKGLLQHIRLNFNDFVDTSSSEFLPYSPGTDDKAWASSSPLGAVFKIIIPPLYDNAAVVGSLVEAHRWRFTTVTTQDTASHPVSGNREWGFRETTNGEPIFYTRGADRSTGAPETILDYFTFAGADKLWLSFQRKLVEFITAHDGAAVPLNRFSRRFKWTVVKILLSLPDTELSI